jgi:hypothetical protein
MRNLTVGKVLKAIMTGLTMVVTLGVVDTVSW